MGRARAWQNSAAQSRSKRAWPATVVAQRDAVLLTPSSRIAAADRRSDI